MVNEFHHLPPKAQTMIRLRRSPALGIAVLLAAVAVTAFVTDAAILGVAALVVAAIVIVAWWIWSGLVYRAYGWKLTDGTVELQLGVIVRRHLVLPRARVQNVTKSAGPVERMLGLATITVHSAGANTPNIAVPDLDEETGDWLRNSLLPTVLPSAPA